MSGYVPAKIRTFAKNFYIVLLVASVHLSSGYTYAQNGESRITTGNSSLSVEGKVEVELSTAINYELEDDDNLLYKAEPSINVELEYKPDDSIRAVLNVDMAREVEGGDQYETDQYTSSLTIDEAFLEFSNLGKSFNFIEEPRLFIGRKEISDRREWFLDTGVDGVILEAELATTGTDFMLSINREEWIGSDMLRSNETDTVTNFILSLEHRLSRNMRIGAHTIIRNDSGEDDDSPHFIGLSARGDIFDETLEYWSNAAVVAGEEDGERISGTGYDIGATIKLTESAGPYATLAYGYGSGDGDRDTDFRQTGLHGNSGRFGGIVNFKYYGELFEPELSNLQILTAGVGYRVSKNASVDLVFHRYEQDVALNRIRSSNLDRRPNGEDTDIGSEMDLIAGFAIGDLETEWVLGYFMPGEAFDNEDTDEAYFFNASFSYEF